jgi:serine/threonine protein kinase
VGLCPTCGRTVSGFSFCPDDGTQLEAEPERTPPLPRELDRYRLLRQVGQGGSSDVFEAEHIHTGKRVALKVLRGELAREPRAVERLRREARSTSSIGHRNIVQVEDFGVTPEGAVYLAMEWLEGETLADRIERGPVPAAAARDLAIQIASGLGAAHAAGVIHRDLKPANVFLVPQPDGRSLVKLLDFGIAKLLLSDTRLTRTGTFIGTPDYVAPEQALGDEVDGRADLYGLGVVLYELLTGTLPFAGEGFMAVLHRHTAEPPEPPTQRAPHRGITPALEAVILRCLAKRPDDRYATAADLIHALDATRAPAPAVDPPSPGLPASPAAPPREGPSMRGAPREGPSMRGAPREGPSMRGAPPAGRTQASLSLELPRRSRAPLWIALLAAAGVGYVLVDRSGIVGAFDPPGQVASTKTIAPGPAAQAGAIGTPAASRAIETPTEAVAPPAAPAGAIEAPGPTPEAIGGSGQAADGQSETQDPSRGTGDPAAPKRRGAWTFAGEADGFRYTVRVKPRAIRPRKRFEIEIEIRLASSLAKALRPSALRARLTFARGDRVELRGDFPVGDGNRVNAALTLPRAGTHRVELALVGDSELGRATFDLCVGADPSGPRRALERVCPGADPQSAP